MAHTIKHLLLLTGVLPFLPYLLFQGYYIRKKVPRLDPPTDMKGSHGDGSPSINLLAIGESTVAGIGVDSHRDGIAGQLAHFLNKKTRTKIDWQVFAKSGLTTSEVATKIQSEPIAISPDIIVIGIGANDGFRLKSPAAFKKNVQAIIILLKKKFPHKPIVFANMPPISLFPAFPSVVKFFVGNTIDIYRKELADLTKNDPLVYFDDRKIEDMDWEVDERPMTDFFSDGVHPSKLTYRMWAENIGAFILEKDLIA